MLKSTASVTVLGPSATDGKVSGPVIFGVVIPGISGLNFLASKSVFNPV